MAARAPGMVVIAAGRFRMGCVSDDDACWHREKPVREVTIPASFALSVHEVTFDDYDRFTYPTRVNDQGWGRGRRPAMNVSWNDARATWNGCRPIRARSTVCRARRNGNTARAGTTTKYSWGDGINRNNCAGCRSQWGTSPVGSSRRTD